MQTRAGQAGTFDLRASSNRLKFKAVQQNRHKSTLTLNPRAGGGGNGGFGGQSPQNISRRGIPVSPTRERGILRECLLIKGCGPSKEKPQEIHSLAIFYRIRI